MIYNTVSFKEILARLVNTYNIKSADFVPRLPIWVGEALGQLNIIMALQPAKTRVEVNEYKAKLPSTIKKLHSVEYDGNIVPRLNGMIYEYINSNGLSESYSQIKLVQDIEYDDNGNISSVRTTDSQIPVSRTNEYHYVLHKNGYIEFTVQTAELVLYFYKIPEEIDENTGMYFPLIPDDDIVKEAIMWYCLKNMLYRGYKHDVLSLASPNRYLNPAIQWDYYMPRAQNKASSPDRAEREAHSQIWRGVVLDADKFEHSFVSQIQE